MFFYSNGQSFVIFFQVEKGICKQYFFTDFYDSNDQSDVIFYQVALNCIILSGAKHFPVQHQA